MRLLNTLHRGVDLLNDLCQALRDLLLLGDGRTQLVLQPDQTPPGVPDADRPALKLPADVKQTGG